MNFYKDYDLQLSEDDEEDEAPRGIDQGGDGDNADDSNRSSVSLSPTLYEEGEKGLNIDGIKEEPMEISDDPIEISDDEDTSPVTHSNNNLMESATIPPMAFKAIVNAIHLRVRVKNLNRTAFRKLLREEKVLPDQTSAIIDDSNNSLRGPGNFKQIRTKVSSSSRFKTKNLDRFRADQKTRLHSASLNEEFKKREKSIFSPSEDSDEDNDDTSISPTPIRLKHIATSSKPKSRSRLKKSWSTPTSKDLNKCYRRSYVKISKLNLGDHVSQLKDLRDSLSGDEKKPKRRRIKQLLRSIKFKSSKNEVGSENSSSSTIIGSKTKNRYRPGPKSKRISKWNDEKKVQDETHCIGDQSADENKFDIGPSRNSNYPNQDDSGDNLNRSLSSLGSLNLAHEGKIVNEAMFSDSEQEDMSLTAIVNKINQSSNQANKSGISEDTTRIIHEDTTRIIPESLTENESSDLFHFEDSDDHYCSGQNVLESINHPQPAQVVNDAEMEVPRTGKDFENLTTAASSRKIKLPKIPKIKNKTASELRKTRHVAQSAKDNNRKLLRDILRKVGLYKPELQKIIEGTEKKTYSIPELGADDSDERRDLEAWNELRNVQSEKEVLEIFRQRFQNKFKANPQINLSTHGFAKQVDQMETFKDKFRVDEVNNNADDNKISLDDLEKLFEETIVEEIFLNKHDEAFGGLGPLVIKQLTIYLRHLEVSSIENRSFLEYFNLKDISLGTKDVALATERHISMYDEIYRGDDDFDCKSCGFPHKFRVKC